MDSPPPAAGAPRPSQGLAVTSLVLGILGNLCFGLLTGIPAVITGHIALNRARTQPHRYGGGGLAIAGLALGYVSFVVGFAIWAILAGLTFPALAQAKSKAQEIQCLNNLKMLGLSARVYSMDHDDRFPRTFEELGPYLERPAILICSADGRHTPMSGTNWATLTPSNVSYELLQPGAKEPDVTAQALFRCPIHGAITRGDGSVEPGGPPRRRR